MHVLIWRKDFHEDFGCLQDLTAILPTQTILPWADQNQLQDLQGRRGGDQKLWRFSGFIYMYVTHFLKCRS